MSASAFAEGLNIVVEIFLNMDSHAYIFMHSACQRWNRQGKYEANRQRPSILGAWREPVRDQAISQRPNN